MDQIVTINVLLEEYFGHYEKSYTALEKAYYDRESLRNVFKTYDVGEQLMEGIMAFNKEESAYVKVNGELSYSFAIGVGVRPG